MLEKEIPRLKTLDVFRGITIAMMILVNSPGNETAYPLLEHAQWNGCTLADLVFPFFLFIVGISLVFALSNKLSKGMSKQNLMLAVTKRAVLIFCLGIFLNAVPYHLDFSTLRVYGVLQRISICYLLAAWLFITTRVQTQAMIAVGLLVLYWMLMTYIPVPGYGTHNLTQAGNLAGYIDRLIFSSAHLYEKIFDPEGILSTLPALSTTLIGNITGAWLLSHHSALKKTGVMLIAGVLGLATGWLGGFWFPINKNLWSDSFVLWTAGFSLLLLATCYWLIEIKQWQRWSKPFEIFGLNAIALYLLHIYFLRFQHMIHISRIDGSTGHLRFYITEHLFNWASLPTASMLYACTYVLFWLVIFSLLYRKKIFIRI